MLCEEKDMDVEGRWCKATGVRLIEAKENLSYESGEKRGTS